MDFANYKKLEFRRKFWRIFGAEIDIFDPESDQTAGFIEMMAWRLKEDVRIYNNKSKGLELLRIHARSIIDFGAAYDVFDSRTDTLLFTLRRSGLKSAFMRDHWQVTDAGENQIATLQETSHGLALIRRYTDLIPFVGPFIDLAMAFFPLSYSVVSADGKPAATLVHQRNPLLIKFSLEHTSDTLDPRIAVALTAMLTVIDASKN